MSLIDTHAHLLPECFNDQETDRVIQEARDQGIIALVNVGTDLSSSHYVSQMSSRYQDVYAAVGLHPHEAGHFTPDTPAHLMSLAKDNQKIVAIGEIGLDYHYNHSDRKTQRQVFHQLLSLARQVDLPVILHVREAWQDCFDIIRSVGFDTQRIVFHCFSGNAEVLEIIREGSALISLTGMITFPTYDASILREFPPERMMLETDCPYLAPVPHRGSKNRPGYLPLIAKKLAEITHATPEHIEETTTANAQRFFAIK